MADGWNVALIFSNKRISTGEISNLKTYREIAYAMGGGESNATIFFDEKIKVSKNGENEIVIADESQTLFLILTLVQKAKKK